MPHKKKSVDPMKKVISSAVKCTIYKESLSVMGHKNPDIQLNDFPLLTKTQLRKRQDDFLVRPYTKKDMVVEYTSGSTGVPVACYRSKKEQTMMGMILDKARRNLAPNLNYARMVEFNSHYIPSVFTVRGRSKILSLSSLYSDEKMVSYYLRLIQDFKPTLIQGLPSNLIPISNLVEKNNLELDLKDLTLVESKSEMLFDSQRRLIEDTFKTKVGNFYGSREFWLIGYSCLFGSIHISVESVYLEIFNKHNEIVNNGEEGDIVITGKVNNTMPLIRYKIGDYGKISITECDCGDHRPVLKLVGRNSVEILTKRGLMSRTLLNPLWDSMHKCKNIMQAQIIQNSIGSFTIKYIGTEIENVHLHENLKKQLEMILRTEVELSLQFVQEIKPDIKSGKVQSFIPISCTSERVN